MTATGPFKVTQGHWCWYPSKVRLWLHVSEYTNLYPILYRSWVIAAHWSNYHSGVWGMSLFNSLIWVEPLNSGLQNMAVTSVPKVIWEEGRIAALSHTYAVKSPLVTMARRKFAPKSTPSRGPIRKPHYLPHPWTRLTYDAKRHPDRICRFSRMHWTDRRTHVCTDIPTDRLSTGKVWRL